MAMPKEKSKRGMKKEKPGSRRMIFEPGEANIPLRPLQRGTFRSCQIRIVHE
jgi:hypothetical protein